MLKVTRLRMVRKTVLLGSAAAASAFTPAPSATLFGQPKVARARAATGTANLRAEEGFRDTIGKMFGMQQKVGRGIKKGHMSCTDAYTHACIHTRQVKCGINGFGRIGRQVARIMIESEDCSLLHINAGSATPDYMAYQYKYDSVHKRVGHEVVDACMHTVMDGCHV